MEGNALYNCNGGPTNFLVLGYEMVCENLLSLISDCKKALKADFSDFESIVIGTAGAGRISDAEMLEKRFAGYIVSKGIRIKSFHVESDARIGLEGAFPGKPGCILISGTGSIMYGKDSGGNTHRVGGFGRYIGDQGSGYMLGKKGLIAVSKELDGRGPHTSLTALVKEKFGFDSSEKLITGIYSKNFDIASVALHVIETAQTGDQVCLNILLEEIDELLLHLYAMQKRFNGLELTVALAGSIISSDNYFAELFKNETTQRLSGVIIKEPEYPPAMGAVFMAMQRIVS
jgi:N-acetylglucosamine kinase-like BadF-type ATPase